MPHTALSHVCFLVDPQGLVKKENTFLESSSSDIGEIVGNGIKFELLNMTPSDRIINAWIQPNQPSFFLINGIATKMPYLLTGEFLLKACACMSKQLQAAQAFYMLFQIVLISPTRVVHSIKGCVLVALPLTGPTVDAL